ncbi:hypothetical protein CERSUDRAFT_111298 [Gelatoporia subvermispora B]|uniref:CcmS related domain-containing protein n=1 Tax=Ceriporiopsis subvermispora (strain B) TaxID=914234 RepID=M2RPB3_CERS8|nr:hypothetical protein CERSUDRAFT_111298 [Gelatoporia subvermispora B]
MNSGWGGGGGGGGWSDHRNDGEDEWDAVARSEAWDTPAQAMGWGDPPPAQAPAQPPAVAQYSQAAWSQWHAEAKGAPKPHQPAAQQNAMRAQQQALQAALQAAQQRQPPPQSLAAQLQQQTIKQEKIRHAQLQQQAAAAMHSHSRAPSHRQHRQHQHPSSQSRHPPVQQNNSWGTWGTQAQDSGWGDIQEEDEEEDEEEEEEYDEEEEEYADEGWGNEYAHRVRFTPSVAQSYESQHHAAASHYSPAQSTHRAQTYRPPTQSTSFSPAYAANARLASQARPYKFWAGPGSKTMEMATGNHFQVGGANGAAFPIIESQGVALDPARTALFGHTRPPKDRIHWGFNPEKDPRVGSLLRWIQEMSSSLGALGLQKFLQTGERGALISNAAYRTDADSAVPNQPAFDWITVTYLHKTLDRILQESVVCYDPASQVIVFVFLLSKSGNSMAVWRKKINLSETIRQMHYGAILSVTGQLKELPVYVDVLPAKPEEPKKKGILSKRKWFKLGK